MIEDLLQKQWNASLTLGNSGVWILKRQLIWTWNKYFSKNHSGKSETNKQNQKQSTLILLCCFWPKWANSALAMSNGRERAWKSWPWSLNSYSFCNVIAVFQIFLFLLHKFSTCYNYATCRLISGLTPCIGCWHFTESLSVKSKNKATNKLGMNVCFDVRDSSLKLNCVHFLSYYKCSLLRRKKTSFYLQ